MIKGISGSNGIIVNNTYTSWPSFYSSGSNQLGVGNMRYSGSSQSIEVFDGNNWLTLTGAHPSIELNGDVQYILNWARGKMAEEARIKELADKHLIVADALEAVKQAEEQVKIVAALVDTA